MGDKIFASITGPKAERKQALLRALIASGGVSKLMDDKKPDEFIVLGDMQDDVARNLMRLMGGGENPKTDSRNAHVFYFKKDEWFRFMEAIGNTDERKHADQDVLVLCGELPTYFQLVSLRQALAEKAGTVGENKYGFGQKAH